MAIVSLVRAGAPQRLLWAEPEIVDLEALPKGSLLRQQIEDAELEYELGVRQREASFCFMSRAWNGLKLLCSEWLLHCWP